MQVDAKYYDESDKFKPDRFNAKTPTEVNQLSRPYYPFGTHRAIALECDCAKCRLQTKIELVVMLQKFKFGLADKLKGRNIQLDSYSLLLRPLGRIRLHVFKR